MNGLITAIRTLTAIPVPGKDADDLSESLLWFPVVGLMLGMSLFITATIIQNTTPIRFIPIIAAAVVLGGALLTRGMHLDGLADWADGFWGGMQREKVLEIMKDSCIGSYGTIALISIILIKWICITQLLQFKAGIWIAAAAVVSRTIQVNLAAGYPYARTTDGTGAPFIKNANKSYPLIAAAIAISTLAIIMHSLLQPLSAITLGWIISILIGNRSRSRIGGITGDVIGAASELTETAILVLAALYAK